MTTISGLPNGTTPLTGAERFPADESLAGATKDFTTLDMAKYAQLVTMLNSGQMPDRIDAAGAFLTTQEAGDPATVWFAPTMSTLAGFGPVVEKTGSIFVVSRTPFLASGRVFEVEAEVEQISVGGGESPIARVGLYSLKSDYTTVTAPTWLAGANSEAKSGTLTAAQIVTVKARFAAADGLDVTGWRSPSTTIFVRGFVEANLKSDLSGYCTTSIARVRRFTVRDVTAAQQAREAAEALAWYNE